MTDLVLLGTGVMGLPMARNLNDEGFAVHAWNRTPEKARPLQAEGIQVYEDPAAAAAGCPLLVTMLADADAVLEVAGRALDVTDGVDTWIQMSTIGTEGTERCLALADEHDVTFVDAPVLGTRTPAEQGTLVVLASGPESARPAADPVFAAVGARTIWLGEAGAGSAAKLMLNSWVLGIVGALSETISLARATDVDPQVFFDAIEGGALDLPYAHMKGPAMAQESFDDVSFALSLARKDAQLVLAAARTGGIELPIMRDVLDRLERAEADGHGERDMAAMYLARPAGSPDAVHDNERGAHARDGA
jgi:3-hydroxyisobutyrate dehydrogenase